MKKLARQNLRTWDVMSYCQVNFDLPTMLGAIESPDIQIIGLLGWKKLSPYVFENCESEKQIETLNQTQSMQNGTLVAGEEVGEGYRTTIMLSEERDQSVLTVLMIWNIQII